MDDASGFAPMLLISMPNLADPNFARSVILLCEYGKNGAFGLVVNRRMAEPAHEVVAVEPEVAIQKDLHLFTGGPVEPMRAWVLTAHATLDDDATEIADGVYLTASPAVVRGVLQAPPSSDTRVVVGYAGWGPGQLDEELAQSSWLLAPLGADLVFDSRPDTVWDRALSRLGATAWQLQGSSGVH